VAHVGLCTNPSMRHLRRGADQRAQRAGGARCTGAGTTVHLRGPAVLHAGPSKPALFARGTVPVIEHELPCQRRSLRDEPICRVALLCPGRPT